MNDDGLSSARKTARETKTKQLDDTCNMGEWERTTLLPCDSSAFLDEIQHWQSSTEQETAVNTTCSGVETADSWVDQSIRYPPMTQLDRSLTGCSITPGLNGPYLDYSARNTDSAKSTSAGWAENPVKSWTPGDRAATSNTCYGSMQPIPTFEEGVYGVFDPRIKAAEPRTGASPRYVYDETIQPGRNNPVLGYRAPSSAEQCLACGYSAGKVRQNDVLLGRGPLIYQHEGNLRFHQLKMKFQEAYFRAPNAEKKVIAQQLVDLIREKGGRFLKWNNEASQWFTAPNEAAQAKAARALRETQSTREVAKKSTTYGIMNANSEATAAAAASFAVPMKDAYPHAKDACTSSEGDTETIRSTTPTSEDYVDDVEGNDVLLGRGPLKYHHSGNVRFHEEKKKLQNAYLVAPNNRKKSISQILVDTINGRGGRFLKYDDVAGRWYRVESK